MANADVNEPIDYEQVAERKTQHCPAGKRAARQAGRCQ